MLQAYEKEADTKLSGAIVEILWQFRDPGLVDFLASALMEDHKDIWDPALDGLVTLGNSKALEKLVNILKDDLDQKKRKWIEEAVGQLRSQIDERTF